MSKALTDLLAKIEAGEKYETMGHTLMCQKAFPKPDDFNGSREAYASSATQQAILAWRNDDLNAAKALHEAVLPEMWDWLVRNDPDFGVFANVTTDDFEWCGEYSGGEIRNHVTSGASFSAYAKTPARAWLIVILKALIAKDQTNV